MRIRGTILLALFFTALSSGCGGGSAEQAPPPVQQQIDIERVVNMPAGFQVVGAHGAVQIDGNYANLGLVAKGTVTIPAAGSITPSTPSAASLPPQISMTGITPILCLRPLVVNAALASVKKNGSTFSYTVIGSASASGETFQWYLFDQMSLAIPLSTGNAGLQVFNASGQIVFDSNAHPMRLAAVGKIPDAGLVNIPASVSAPIPGTYAACISQGRIDSIYFNLSRQTQVFGEGVLINQNGATTAPVPNYFVGFEIHPKASNGGQILLVDVSGL